MQNIDWFTEEELRKLATVEKPRREYKSPRAEPKPKMVRYRLVYRAPELWIENMYGAGI